MSQLSLNEVLGVSNKKAKVKRGYHLIIDGNFILNKVLHPLHSKKRMDMLYDSLIYTVMEYRKIFNFDNIFFVSDKGKSWRTRIYPKYKSTRSTKKKQDIDWNYVYGIYEKVKEHFNSTQDIHLLEKDTIEGDDWAAYLIKVSNMKGYSTLTISNDRDLVQLMTASTEEGKEYVNFMINDMNTLPLMFLPNDYEYFCNHMKNNNQLSLFNLTDDTKFIKFIEKQRKDKEVRYVNHLESLLIKVIWGDDGDDIDSVILKPSAEPSKKTGEITYRGIGKKSAEKIAATYITENATATLSDIWSDELCEDISMLCLDNKKMGKEHKPNVISRIKENIKVISLDVTKFPGDVVSTMKSELKEKLEYKRTIKESFNENKNGDRF